jgi:hypothetical protein
MDATLVEYLRSLGVHPAMLALAPLLVSLSSKAINFYIARRRKEHETQASKIYLEHLKLHLEIKRLATDEGEHDLRSVLPGLPPLPELYQTPLLLPERTWVERLRWAIGGSLLVYVPIYLIDILPANTLDSSFKDWGRVGYGLLLLFVAAAISIVLAFSPIRQRWTAVAMAASVALLVWALAGGFVHLFTFASI